MTGSEGQGRRKASAEPSEPFGTAEDSSSTPGEKRNQVEGKRRKAERGAGQSEECKFVFVFEGDLVCVSDNRWMKRERTGKKKRRSKFGSRDNKS